MDSVLYADDTTLMFSPSKTMNDATLNRRLNTELKSISDWFQTNKLSLNIDKTKYIVFHRPKAKAPDVKLSINGVDLERVTTFKFLGLTLNQHLTWADHIRSITVKIARVVGVMNKLKFSLPQHILLTLYYSLILPHLNFQILCWGTAGNVDHIDDLVKLQKRAIRIIKGASYLAHTAPLFIELKILKLPELVKMFMLKFMHKKVNKKLPKYFLGWKLERGQDFHRWGTRNRHKIVYPIHNYDYFEKLLKYSLIDFNEQPPDLDQG